METFDNDSLGATVDLELFYGAGVVSRRLPVLYPPGSSYDLLKRWC